MFHKVGNVFNMSGKEVLGKILEVNKSVEGTFFEYQNLIHEIQLRLKIQ